MNDTNESPNTTPKPEPTATPATAKQAAANNGLAVAAFVTGLVAFVLGWAVFVGFIIGVAAIILGILSLKKSDNKAFSIVGIVTGAIGALTSLIFTLFFILALVGSSAVITSELSEQLNETVESQQELIDAKKDFAAGETAVFADFEVKVTKVTRDYVPENEFERAEEGKELVIVNLATKNISDSEAYISAYDFDIVANGVGSSPSFSSVDPSFEGGDLEPNAVATGNIVYEVPKGATELKLKYMTYAGGEELTYTLAL